MDSAPQNALLIAPSAHGLCSRSLRLNGDFHTFWSSFKKSAPSKSSTEHSTSTMAAEKFSTPIPLNLKISRPCFCELNCQIDSLITMLIG